MRTHYFGGNTSKDFYKEWTKFQTECGIIVSRSCVTNNINEVSCGNCLRLLDLN